MVLETQCCHRILSVRAVMTLRLDPKKEETEEKQVLPDFFCLGAEGEKTNMCAKQTLCRCCFCKNESYIFRFFIYHSPTVFLEDMYS